MMTAIRERMLTPSLRHPRRIVAGWLTLCLLAAGALLSGCAAMQAAEARSAYLAKELGAFEYPKSCLDLWPSVVRLLAAKGYSGPFWRA